MRHLFFQKILIDGAEVEMSRFRSGTYVETLDMSGPRIMLDFYELDRSLQDDYGAKDGKTLTVTMDDSLKRGGISYTEVFIIRSVISKSNKIIRIEGITQAVDQTKAPATQATFLTKKTVQAIMGATVGGGDVDPYPIVPAFHLSPGERLSKKLRQLSREYASRVFFRRGTWYFKDIAKLWAKPPVETYYHDDMRKDPIIDGYQNVYQDNLSEDRITRHYLGWHIVEGQIAETIHGSDPAELTQYHQIGQLNNISTHIAPAIIFTTDGNGAIEPGQRIKLRFARSKKGRPYDENIPEIVLITEVAHWYSEQKYQTLVKAGVYKP